MNFSRVTLRLMACVVALGATARPSDAGRYVLSASPHAETEDLDAAVRAEFGRRARVADWEVLKRSLTTTAKVQAFVDAIHLSSGESVLLYRNGMRWWENSIRHYSMTRNDHVLPGGYLSHDSIDDHFLDLGSWYGLSQKILVELRPEPQYSALTSIGDLNGDGVIDHATLALKSDRQYYLQTINGANGKQIKQVKIGDESEVLPLSLSSSGETISVLIKEYSSGGTLVQTWSRAGLRSLKEVDLPKK